MSKSHTFDLRKWQPIECGPGCKHIIDLKAFDTIRRRVDVRISREDGRALLEVEDNGPGMAPELVRMRLHHPFNSTKRKGFGLGLYECRDLARTLGGGLTIESEVGAGTLARVWLPLVDADGSVSQGSDARASASESEDDSTAHEERI